MVASALCAPTVATADAPARVMSIATCANQLVLALADHAQIVSLFRGAGDPRISFLYERAEGIPLNRGAAEEVIAAEPDLVFSGQFDRRTTKFLERFGVRVVRLRFPKTITQVKQQVHEVAQLLGHPERGKQLAGEIDARIDEARSRIGSVRPVGVVYRGSGFSFGSDTLVHALLAAGGIDNLAAKMGYKRADYVPLEILVAGQPDLLLDDTIRGPLRPRVGAEIVRHPAIDRGLPTAGRAEFPVAYWLCGGASTPAAITAANDIAHTFQTRAIQSRAGRP